MRKQLLVTLLATFFVFTDATAQVTEYISGLNSPTQMTLDGTTIYVNGWGHIYTIDTTVSPASATLLYTLPPDFYAYKTEKLGNDLFVLVENYIEATDSFEGMYIVKLDVTNIGAGPEVVISSPLFIASFVLNGNTIYFSEEQETAPDVYTTDIYSFDATQSSPTPTLEYTDIGLNDVPVDDVAVHNDVLYISSGGAEKIFTLDLSSSASEPVEYLNTTELNFNKGIFISPTGYLYITNAHEIEKIDVNNSGASLEFVGNQTVYEDVFEGNPYYANFRDVVLIDNTLYMTLENQGRIVTLTDMSLSTEEVVASRNALKLYPNPVNDLMHLEIPNEGIKMVEVYNLRGQKLETFVAGFDTVSVGHLSDGMYLLRVTSTEGTTHIRKLIKE
jgi:hypothetical protein